VCPPLLWDPLAAFRVRHVSQLHLLSRSWLAVSVGCVVWHPAADVCRLHGQVLYVASMIRSVIALHDLVLNKIAFKDVEEQRDREDKDKSEKGKATGAGKDKDAAGAGKGGKEGVSESKEAKP
jgi:hypothetical protein